MNASIEKLLRAAVQAPSGDNTQPWQFEIIHAERRVDCRVDETRDPSPMNAGQRMARIAVGAAVENMLLTAEGVGLSARPTAPPSGSVAAITWDSPAETTPHKLSEVVFQRVTNRRPYDGRPAADAVIESLRESTPPLDGVNTFWICERSRIAAGAELIGRADALMFGDPSMRAAFLAKVRFDAPPTAEVEEGLCMASLEAAPAQRFALRLMGKIPDRLLKIGGVKRTFAALARKLVNSAAGLCVVTAPDESPATDVLVGRAMQRAWLALTACGLAAQPMMSLMVLDNTLQHGSPALIQALGRNQLLSMREQTRSLVPEAGSSRPAFLFRFGHAASPSGRTGRLPLEASVNELGSGKNGS